MRVFNKAGSKKRLFEMMAVVNKTPITEKFFSQEELNEIAALYKAQKNEGWDYNPERDDLAQQDVEHDENVSDENKNFDLVKSELNKQFNPEIIHDDEHEFKIRINKPDGNSGVYKIVRFYIKNDEGVPLYGIYKYDDKFDGFDLMHDENGSRSVDYKQIANLIAQDN